MSAVSPQRGEKTLMTDNGTDLSVKYLTATRYNDLIEARRLTPNLNRLADDLTTESEHETWKRSRIRDDLKATASTLRYVARQPLDDIDTAHAYLAAAIVTRDRITEARLILESIGGGGPL